MPLWIGLALGALSLFNGLGALNVLAALPTLRELPLGVPLVVLLGVPMAWCAIFAGLSLGWLLKRRRVVRLFAPLMAAYALSRLGVAFLAQSDYDQGRLGAQIALTALWIGAAWWYARRIEGRLARQTDSRAAEG